MAVKLTADQMAELQESFAMFDRNCDGMITPGELVTLMKSMNKKITDQKVKKMIDSMDTDGNGKIDFQEFCGTCKTVLKTQDSLDRAFKEFDMDGNGFVTEDELHTVMTRLGQALDMSQIQQMIQSADKDGDGRVNYKEFLRLMTKK